MALSEWTRTQVEKVQTLDEGVLEELEAQLTSDYQLAHSLELTPDVVAELTEIAAAIESVSKEVATRKAHPAPEVAQSTETAIEDGAQTADVVHPAPPPPPPQTPPPPYGQPTYGRPSMQPAPAAPVQSGPPPPPPQEAARTTAGSGPWYERRAVLVSSAVAAVLGAVLILVGIAAFASAAKTNSDAQATKDQVSALESETATLQQQRDVSQAEAATASAKETAESGHTADVKRAVRELHNTTHDTVRVYNSFSECSGLTNDLNAFVACENSWLQRFQAAVTNELNAVATTRTAIAALEEDLRA